MKKAWLLLARGTQSGCPSRNGSGGPSLSIRGSLAIFGVECVFRPDDAGLVVLSPVLDLCAFAGAGPGAEPHLPLDPGAGALVDAAAVRAGFPLGEDLLRAALLGRSEAQPAPF